MRVFSEEGCWTATSVCFGVVNSFGVAMDFIENLPLASFSDWVWPVDGCGVVPLGIVLVPSSSQVCIH